MLRQILPALPKLRLLPNATTMKTTTISALFTGLLAWGTLLTGTSLGQNTTDPAIPVGSLSAYPTIVQTGTHPTLSWSITHPATVTEVVTITPPGTIIPKRTLTMQVRVIGASVKRVWLDSRGRVVDWEWVPTEALISNNNSSYSRIWYNTQDHVTPNQIVYTRTVYNNQPVKFGGRYLNSNNSWSTMFTSTTNNYNVVALKHGDTPPTTTPLYQQPTLESFLRPYLDDNGNIKIGPMDVIYLMELTHTDRNDGGFDLQDLVILVTFQS